MTPYPLRIDQASVEAVTRLKDKTKLNRAEIIRRALRFSLPKFEAGEVDISTLTPREKARRV